MGVKVKQGYKTDYIPFEHVLKKNYLLQEEVAQLSHRLKVALNAVSQQEQMIDLLISENKRNMLELNEATRSLYDRHEMIEGIVKTMVEEKRKYRNMSQENVKLAVKIKESDKKIKELLGSSSYQDVVSGPSTGEINNEKNESCIKKIELPKDKNFSHDGSLIGGESEELNLKLSDELSNEVELLTLNEEVIGEEVCEQVSHDVKQNKSCSNSKISLVQISSDASLNKDEGSSKRRSNLKNVPLEVIDTVESDWLLWKMKNEFAEYNEQMRQNYNSQGEDTDGYYTSESDNDSSGSQTSEDEISVTDSSITSTVGPDEHSYMLVPPGLMIQESLKLVDANIEKVWFLKSKVKKKLRLFVERDHKILGEYNSAERSRQLEKLLVEVKEGLTGKRFEKWKALNEFFMKYYTITEL